jgi:hypothetical protein
MRAACPSRDVLPNPYNIGIWTTNPLRENQGNQVVPQAKVAELASNPVLKVEYLRNKEFKEFWRLLSILWEA